MTITSDLVLFSLCNYLQFMQITVLPPDLRLKYGFYGFYGLVVPRVPSKVMCYIDIISMVAINDH